MINNTCCRDCNDRHIACHDSCDRYLQWRRAYDEDKALAVAYSNKNREMNGYEKDKKHRLITGKLSNKKRRNWT